jgi:hypothetical protein
MAFAMFAFMWTWYVGAVVLLLSPRRPERPNVGTPAAALETS